MICTMEVQTASLQIIFIGAVLLLNFACLLILNLQRKHDMCISEGNLSGDRTDR